jgi:hypothetical protein
MRPPADLARADAPPPPSASAISATSASAAWPLAARAQQPVMPVISDFFLCRPMVGIEKSLPVSWRSLYELVAGFKGRAPTLADGASRGASSSMARTGKRKAGGLARVQSRQARLSVMYAKRLARSQAASRRKTPASDELPWWARPRAPGQR